MRFLSLALCASLSAAAIPAFAQESLWLEAEHFDGLRGYCWPMGKPEMKKTAGHWALSGPGWAAEWNQGGESGFLSIATAADDDKAVVTKTVDVPLPARITSGSAMETGGRRPSGSRFKSSSRVTETPS